MDSSTQSILVTILGDEYSIKGDVDSETTKKVAGFVNEKMTAMHEKTASHNKVKVAILTALNIAGELFELKSRNQEFEKQFSELEKRTELLTKKIDCSL